MKNAADDVTPSMRSLLNQETHAAPPAETLATHYTAKKKMSPTQQDIVTKILRSPHGLQAISSIAGTGKSLIMGHILENWSLQAKAENDKRMAWIMVPRLVIKTGKFEALRETFKHGELMIWGKTRDNARLYDDYLDAYCLERIEALLGAKIKELQDLDDTIREATESGEKEKAVKLHARRYKALRQMFIATMGDMAEECLDKVRAVVLTAEQAITILGGTSKKHRCFVRRGVGFGFVDGCHNITTNQLLALSSHIDKMICTDGPLAQIGFNSETSDYGGGSMKWILQTETPSHKLHEVRRFGQNILDLLRLGPRTAHVKDILSNAACHDEARTDVRFFHFHSLEWDYLKDNNAWKCKKLFTLILACTLKHAADQQVLIIVYYKRVRHALEAFLQEALEGTPSSPEITVASPKQVAGMNVKTAIFLCAHKKKKHDDAWYTDSKTELAPGYTGMTRADSTIYLIVESPPPAKRRRWEQQKHGKQKPDYWAAVATHLKVPSKTLYIHTECKTILNCTTKEARDFVNRIGEKFEKVNWTALAAPFERSTGNRTSTKTFFTNPKLVETELASLTANGKAFFDRHISQTISVSPPLTSSLIGQETQDRLNQWKKVFVPAWTVLLTGPQTAHMEFTFLPHLLETGKQRVQEDFDEFVTTLCTIVAVDVGKRMERAYHREVYVHQPEHHRDIEDFSFFFTKRRTAIQCTKIYCDEQDKTLLYAYNGMGVHRSHTEWWSMVMRSGSTEITAQVLKRIAADGCEDSGYCLHNEDNENFVNALPTTCRNQYNKVLGVLKAALKNIGEQGKTRRPPKPPHSTPQNPTPLAH